MARIPRDDNTDQKPTSELAINLQNMLDAISENLKTIVDGDSLKVRLLLETLLRDFIFLTIFTFLFFRK